MKDYNSIPFKNAAIDRLSSQTTSPDLPGRFVKQYNKATDKSNKAQEKLAKYVKSPKAPNLTKSTYNEASKFLGGQYDYKQLNKMTDVDYNDKKAQKFKSMADKSDVKVNKIDARVEKYYKRNKPTGLEYEPKVRKRHMKP